MSTEVLAPAMFACLALVLMIGFPVAFSVAAVAGVFGAIGVASGQFPAPFLLAGTLRVEGFFNNDNLLAIPLFVSMGMVLERSGLAADMLLALDELFGSVRGGIAYAVVVVGGSLAAITGFVSAAVIGIALMALPPMLRKGYDPRLATGLIAATGTLAQILPPSLVLIVLAEQLEVPLTDMYRGALLPSLLLAGLYLLYIFFVTRRWPQRAPSGRTIDEGQPAARRWANALVAAVFPIALILLVLLSIFFGIATPSEGGAVGASGAVALGFARRRLDLRRLGQAMEAAGVLCSGLLFLLFGASFFTLVFRGLDGQQWIESLFAHLPAGPLGFLVFVNVAVFLLAFFLDFFEIAFIVLPLIEPVARKLGIDMTWLAVLLAVNLQTSFMHPPFGLALYNLRNVAPPAVRTTQIYRGAIPFLLIQLTLVALLIAMPSIVLKNEVTPVRTDNVEIPMPPRDDADSPAR
jgi:tripartite ATP-independent transporter DctM subunit